MIELRNVSLVLGGKTVLSNICATVQPGECIMIVGENGAGKSSLFSLLAGAHRPTSGTILINGQDTASWSLERYTATVSSLLQDPRQATAGPLSVQQNLALAVLRTQAASARNALDTVNDEQKALIQAALMQPDRSFLSKPVASLSGGQRQILAFVMATLTPPPVLLLDEPTAALDPAAAQRLITLALHFIREHATTTLWITHDPAMAIALGTTLWVLEGGKLVATYTGAAKRALSPSAFTHAIDYEALAQERGE